MSEGKWAGIKPCPSCVTPLLDNHESLSFSPEADDNSTELNRKGTFSHPPFCVFITLRFIMSQMVVCFSRIAYSAALLH